MRVLSDINVTFAKFTPLAPVPCHCNSLSWIVSGEVMKICFIQDMLDIRTLLETHEVEWSIAMNEMACTVAISMPHTKKVPPEEIVSKDFDLQRLTNFFRARVTSR